MIFFKILILLAIIALVYFAWRAVCLLLYKKEKIQDTTYRTMSKTIPLYVFEYAILLFVTVCILMPFLYALLLSFKVGGDVYATSLFPKVFSLENYKYALTSEHLNLIRGFFNAVGYAVLPTFFGVFTSAMAAYALSRLHFKWRDRIFGIMFATMCIPGVITLIPSYIMFSRIYGWTGTPLPLIIPGMFGSVGVMFFLRQSFLQMPKELDEAGILDGLSKGGVFFKISLPLCWAPILAQILLSFNGAYNDFMTPLLYLGSEKQWATVQLSIYSMYSTMQTAGNNMAQVMAACVIALVPSIILFFFAQKYFMGSGISASGLKG